MNKVKIVAETLAELHEYYRLTDIERQPKQLKTADFDGPVVFSDDPKIATVSPAFFTVQTIQELKRLGGVPDSDYGPGGMEPHHPLPEPYSAERLANVTGNHADVCKAFRAYIYGDSALVKDYENILNAKRFPLKIALYGGDSITISAGNPLIVQSQDNHGEPIVLVYEQITVEPGGQIIYRTNGAVQANTMTMVSALDLNNDSFNIINQGNNGSHGANGGSGGDGKNGSNGNAGQNNKNSCAKAATAGTNGANGVDGGSGSNGENGGNAADINLKVGQVTGVVSLASIGGNGGDGGNGGHGGIGGNGGNGGSSTDYCSAGRGGNGGSGGDGGNGGNSGKGGNGGNIYFRYDSGTPTIDAKSVGGSGGARGYAGYRGSGGNGGSGSPYGSAGSSGVSGKDGVVGTTGVKGHVYINGREQS
ncbi:hypothetical protein [Photorhabdus khanii]|uniref:Collagen-like protein n=1 Tax=Photorhabdus khanii subsp. guanajuatensis TaxID=2100166 RepID=A0A4R4K6D5_9GAMM|nr:hypothetical protein [Photorhabdus khanii]TDB62106.1 hypothetical protein C5467_02845 [Photorhabdus khanii subsp. guanajuatensis]